MNRSKKNKQKVPEKSISEKVNFYKGEIRSLRKEVENLRKRIGDLERKMATFYKLEEKQEKFKSKKEMKRQEILRRFHPDYDNE